MLISWSIVPSLRVVKAGCLNVLDASTQDHRREKVRQRKCKVVVSDGLDTGIQSMAPMLSWQACLFDLCNKMDDMMSLSFIVQMRHTNNIPRLQAKMSSRNKSSTSWETWLMLRTLEEFALARGINEALPERNRLTVHSGVNRAGLRTES